MTIKQKNNFSIFIFLVSFFLICFFVLNPLLKSIKEMAKELSTQEDKLITLQLKIDNIEQFKTTYEEIEGTLSKMDDLLINFEVPVDFINFLENEAKQFNLDFKISSAINQNTKNNPWPSIVFQATADGEFVNLLKFLDTIENSPYLIDVKNINIRESEDGFIKSNFSIKVFAK